MSTIKHIRKNVLRMTQTAFAARIGVTQPTVCRWEQGGSPSLEEMASIRRVAQDQGIAWDDAWFFDAPQREATPR